MNKQWPLFKKVIGKRVYYCSIKLSVFDHILHKGAVGHSFFLATT
jgi:hypothetical protein